MKKDQRNQIWEKNKHVGYTEDGVLFGINPKTGYAEKVPDKFCKHGEFDGLKKWRKSFTK